MTVIRLSKVITVNVMLAVMVIFLAGFGGPSFSSRAPEAINDFSRHNENNAQAIDHSLWQGLIGKYLKASNDGVNRFAYGKMTAADREALNAYLDQLSKTPISNYRRLEQLAYWINLYNALTVKVVVDHYPVKSIRDIDISGLLANGPWGKELINVEGYDLSLDNVEHNILRPLFRDPRIHYAVNCASIGCPNLQEQAFTGANVVELLTKGAREYINHPRGLSVNNGKVTVSKIYSWFAYDFGNSKDGVLAHLKQYADPQTAQKLSQINDVHDAGYDWQLNE